MVEVLVVVVVDLRRGLVVGACGGALELDVSNGVDRV